MSRTVPPDELFCARCARPIRIGANRLQHRYVCRTCYTRAMETYDTCTGCGIHRLTPGIAPGGGPLCAECAEDIGDLTCRRCGEERLRYEHGNCGRCVLAERLLPLLDDGTGAVRPELVPLFDALRMIDRPRSGLGWIARPHVQRNLRALATGEVPLTHDGLDALTPWRSVAYLRDLLMQAGVLPVVDRQLVLFERWLKEWLAGIEDADHRKLLERFATWHLLRKLRLRAAEQPLGHSRQQSARLALVQSETFLTHLDARGHTLDQCTQADLDAWYAGQTSPSRRLVQGFLRWAEQHRRAPRLTIPLIRTENPAPISQHRRLALIRRMLTDDAIPLVERVVALLILLYAQPVSRLVRLTTADILINDDQVMLDLGDPPSPVPEPFAELLLAYVAARPNQATATNPRSPLLFPGRRAGQALHPATLQLRLHALGIPTLNGRTAAIRQMLLQAPAPVVAKMLGYSSEHAEAVAAEAGGTWKRYASGDHTQ